jgi:hypothetical protein
LRCTFLLATSRAWRLFWLESMDYSADACAPNRRRRAPDRRRLRPQPEPPRPQGGRRHGGTSPM